MVVIFCDKLETGLKHKVLNKDSVVFVNDAKGKALLKQYKKASGKYKVYTLRNSEAILGHRVYYNGVGYDIPIRLGFNFDGDEDIIMVKNGEKWLSSDEEDIVEVNEFNVKWVKKVLC